MLIEFEKLQENLVPKPRGGEGEMYTRTFQDENNKIMQIRLTPGSHLGMHTHEVDSEAFRAAVQSCYEEMESYIGSDWMDQIRGEVGMA